ncbi:MAG: ABC transporter permease [Oscillibacter sp.]|nr:ABC transporter permease [Oscillibacter sp.]
MSVFDYDKNRDNRKPFHAAGMAENAAKRATEDNQDKYAKQDNTPSGGNEEHFSLNDDRRVKVLSPGALVAKRFFRNRLAVVGLSILIFMFVFSFIGGLLSPYGEDEFFYREDQINKEFAVVTENSDFRYMAKDSNLFGSAVQAQTMLAIQKNSESFSYNGTNYALAQEGSDFYSISSGGKLIGIAYKDVVSSSDGQALSFEFVYTALKSYAALAQEVEKEAEQETAGVSEATGATDDAAEPAEPEEVSEPAVKTFTVDGLTYTIDEDGGVLQGEKEVAYISRYIVQAIMPDIFLSRDFKEKLIDTIAVGGTKFTYTDESLILDDEPDAALDGEETGIGAMDDALVEEDDTASDATMEYTIERSQNHANWIIRQQQSSRQYDSYSFPSAKHWLGTDKYGMDMLTRLMYGGRVSLMIGFIVIIIETVLGVILGGIAGYFGGWVDNLIMRLVDIFYCIPSMPIILILGAAMDQQRVEPGKRLIYLMLILGILGWAGIARLVRGQILSLREQEFMTATEACGISVKSRIFKHLIPNVIPQLIVNCTMGLGSVIITEATLSFLGLGVKFPFASWGNIINDVNNTHVLTTYWFIWIPAGLLLLLTVLAFNLVGDGLRDAFDPKMKR